MKKELLYTQLLKKYNEHAYKIVSFITFLQGCYEVASERKQYVRCALIQDLINEQ